MAHKLTLPDAVYDYRLDDTGIYDVRREGKVVAHVMFAMDCPHQSVAMIAMVDALNGAAS